MIAQLASKWTLYDAQKFYENLGITTVHSKDPNFIHLEREVE